ncbi:hypothetical protein PIB30_086184 [Stylosanthes scabra]|uniref:Retrotransposon gag domain-containing protein n=1 Tax=Stylosanthes scabra TaxID=79078 RepID=A0ABU6ZRT2_9FABA|nr:hypothetical protein [Stylosanthes scabra]
MICGATDEVKCRAFPTTLTGLASQSFTSLPAGSISSYSEIRELFLNEFTTSIDNIKHPINLLVVVQKPNETTKKYIERFNAECKTIDVASITEIYHQVSEKGILSKARPLKGRTQNAKNRSLFCNYYQGYGHKTQDCYDPKDAIKQAIRDGKLNEFIQIIREPRTSDRERSPRSESRNPRSRRDDDEPIMEIAVITGSSTMEKSKSALKKDLKILATV